MKYIILAGGSYPTDESLGPRCLWEFNHEYILDRTIALLWDELVSTLDIYVCSNDERVIEHCKIRGYHWFKNPHNSFDAIKGTNLHWVDWVLRDWPGPVCYIFGDVIFTSKAMHEIVWSGDHRSVEFFASAPPFSSNYIKRWAEPFAFKVYDQVGFWEASQNVKKWQDEGKYPRVPIAWELWHAYAHKEPLSDILKFDYSEVHAINDGTCDVDVPEDLERIRKVFSA